MVSVHTERLTDPGDGWIVVGEGVRVGVRGSSLAMQCLFRSSSFHGGLLAFQAVKLDEY